MNASCPKRPLAAAAACSALCLLLPAPARAQSDSDSGASTLDGDPAALVLQDEQPGAAQALEGEPMKIYGFGDIGYRHMLVPEDSPWLVYLNRHPSFFVGHLNFYFDAQLAERWRALAEVRFTYLPQGGWRTNEGRVEYGNSDSADYADFTRDRAVGGLMIERATIDYVAFPFLTIQAGQFLTPYGIWNVDHGSPVIIGVTPPFIIGAKLLPPAQVGLLAHGSSGVARDLELGYALGLANGRTDLIPYEDLDSNKALTLRLSLTLRKFGELQLGSTFYAGRTTDNYRQIYFDSGPKSREVVKYQYDERSLAFDLRFTHAGFHLQAEAIVNERKFDDDLRAPLNGGLEPDRRNAGGYALTGYRLPLEIMPYVKGEYSPDRALQALGVDENVALFTGGINFRPVPRVVFKGEYTYGFFPGAEPGGFAANDLAGLDFQVAWAF